MRRHCAAWPSAALSLIALTVAGPAVAQPGAGPGFAAPRSARESAQVDLTGYWVALVTEDWLWRMITPPPGDATSVPLNAEGRRVAAAWDPARDAASGEACRPFGAAGLMRMPLRLHISWHDDDTLKIETDAGEQTRLLRFGAAPPPSTEKSWQGFTTAEWTRPVGGFDLRAVMSGRPPVPADGPPKGALKAVTTHLRAGYLRKNGVPYSENAVLTEYFSRFSAFGNDYLTVLSIVHDPTYLSSDFVTSSHFKREPDGSSWRPSPCRTAPPLAARGE
ncbi:MAG TPA: hypothetical protein VIN61_14575 [Gammaproteobacteria bacterium]